MFSKSVAIFVPLLLLASAGVARADTNEDYNRCAALQDYKASVACIEKLAENGNPKAQLALGGFYSGGYGVPQDPQRSVYWYQKSADQGNAVAMSRLGDDYRTGNGVTQDYKKAVSWFSRAANQGDAWSQATLGSLYSEGKGVMQDYIEAYKWFDIAVANGDSDAAKLRDMLAQKMTAEQIDEAKKRSSEWLAQSAKQAAAEQSAALSKIVTDCVKVVHDAKASFYTNFDASYNAATGMIEFNNFGNQDALFIFNKCMAVKGHPLIKGPTRTR
jgi:TPR repeat protein